jgi:hypothetical protein
MVAAVGIGMVAAVGIGMVAAVVIGIRGALDPAVKPFGTTVKKAWKKVVEANFLYFVGNARGC